MPNTGLKILFGENYKKWSWVQNQLHYTTPRYIAAKIAKLTRRHYESNLIWDMFAGLGSDTVSFSQEGYHVYAIEILSEIYQLLERNVNIFGLKNKVTSYCCDCVEKIENIQNDSIVYFDPPWGESFNPDKDFSFENVELCNGLNVIELLKNISAKTKNIIIKSPLRCDTFENLEFLDAQKVYIFRKHHIKFIFCTPNSNSNYLDSHPH